MNVGSGNGTGCCQIEVRSELAKLTNVVIAGFRKIGYLVRKNEVFVKHSNMKPSCEQSGHGVG